ncbi:MAG: bacteriohemerythrin [Gammaproteobacteria bacterium]|nr:bacteriohemerythrin [Gammaproteobacteria bacterium]
MLIVWNERYSVGVREIDEQHKRLIGFINELHEAMRSGGSKEVLGTVFAGLIEYTMTHFAAEERFMKAMDYVHYAKHKAAHDGLTKRVLELQSGFQTGEITLSMDLMDFLQKWLMEHIMEVDKELGKFLNDKGIS